MPFFPKENVSNSKKSFIMDETQYTGKKKKKN